MGVEGRDVRRGVPLGGEGGEGFVFIGRPVGWFALSSESNLALPDMGGEIFFEVDLMHRGTSKGSTAVRVSDGEGLEIPVRRGRGIGQKGKRTRGSFLWFWVYLTFYYKRSRVLTGASPWEEGDARVS